jgi:hypothetical protein
VTRYAFFSSQGLPKNKRLNRHKCVINAGMKGGSPSPREYLKQTTVAFLSLLAAVVLLTTLFASGLLRFGQSGTVAYVVYVIAGLLSATLCYGILESTGAFEAQYHKAPKRIHCCRKKR